MQFTAPTGLTEPGGQGTQGLEALTANRPGPQWVQDDAEPKLKLPSAQGSHEFIDWFAYRPGPHGAHAAGGLETNPGLQAVHEELPEALSVPGRHSAHV